MEAVAVGGTRLAFTNVVSAVEIFSSAVGEKKPLFGGDDGFVESCVGVCVWRLVVSDYYAILCILDTQSTKIFLRVFL